MSYEGDQSGELYVPRFATVDGLQAHMRSVFHVRNEVYLPGRAPRIELFENGIHDLVASLRLDNQDLVATALARLTSRMFCIADSLEGVSLSEGLEAKFPESGCLFCGQPSCACGESRATPYVAWPPVRTRQDWSFNDWQNHLWGVYGPANKKRGIESVALRLHAEKGELGAIENHIARGTIKLDQVVPAYSMGTGDLGAWICGVGSLREINVLKATEERYADGCATCGGAQCVCGPAEFDHVYPSLS
jgi:hypothetical protein